MIRSVSGAGALVAATQAAAPSRSARTIPGRGGTPYRNPDHPASADELAGLVDDILVVTGRDLIPILQQLQERLGFLPRNVLEEVSRRTGHPLAGIYGVATFYERFYLQPRGRHVVRVCQGTACHVSNATRITDALCKHFGIQPGETTEDGHVTVETVACVGCCSLAPVVVIGENTHGRCGHQQAVEIVSALPRGK